MRNQNDFPSFDQEAKSFFGSFFKAALPIVIGMMLLALAGIAGGVYVVIMVLRSLGVLPA